MFQAQDEFDNPNQRALLQRLGTGVESQAPPVLPPEASPVAAQATGMAAPAQKPGLGQYASKLEGFGGMLDDGRSKLEHGDSPKYQFARVMSNFDPKGGLSQGMLDQLNALGLGTVSGQIGGDKISIGGQMDPRWNGVTEFDVIRDLENGGGWQWGDISADQGGPQQAQGRGMGGVGMAQSGLNSLLTGDALAGIQQAIGQYAGQGDNLKALLAQLGVQT